MPFPGYSDDDGYDSRPRDSEQDRKRAEPPPAFNRNIGPFIKNSNFSGYDAFLFNTEQVRAMFSGLKTLFIGDSLMRALYKDLVTWSQTNDLLTETQLRERAEPSHQGDRQIDIVPLEKDRIFRQAREYQTHDMLLQFVFTTRAMNEQIERLLLQMATDGYPDVILMNSAVWDMTRYSEVLEENSEVFCPGRRRNRDDNAMLYRREREQADIEEYESRLAQLLHRLHFVLPPHTMFIWVCFPHPIPSDRGFLARTGAVDKNHAIRGIILEANYRASQIVRRYGYDVLDLSFYFRNHALFPYRTKDGIHWNAAGTRLMSQLLLIFLCRSWDIPINEEKLTRNMEQELDENIKTCLKMFKSMNGRDGKASEGAAGENEALPHYAEKQDNIAARTFNAFEGSELMHKVIGEGLALVEIVTRLAAEEAKGESDGHLDENGLRGQIKQMADDLKGHIAKLMKEPNGAHAYSNSPRPDSFSSLGNIDEEDMDLVDSPHTGSISPLSTNIEVENMELFDVDHSD